MGSLCNFNAIAWIVIHIQCLQKSDDIGGCGDVTIRCQIQRCHKTAADGFSKKNVPNIEENGIAILIEKRTIGVGNTGLADNIEWVERIKRDTLHGTIHKGTYLDRCVDDFGGLTGQFFFIAQIVGK